MKSALPEKLGLAFWLGLPMIATSLWFAYLGYMTGSGRNLLGSLLVAAIFAWGMFDRAQKVRLARLLKQNPRVRQSYESVERSG
ncbi:hypothetical protein ACG3SL_01445 [Sphingomonas sp. CJ20]